MAKISLELWQNPNFPPLEILESRTKSVLGAFNRIRKLDIKLQTNDKKINEFYPLFNSLTEKRAVESLRLSMYAEDVGIYLKLLSEENTIVGVILETLSSLLDMAQDRQKDTKKLKKDYQGFLENFNREFANIQIRFTSDSMGFMSDSQQIVIRNQNDAPIIKSLVIEVAGIIIPILSGYGAFKLFNYGISKFSLNGNSFIGLFTFGISGLFFRYFGNLNNQSTETTKDNDLLTEENNQSTETTKDNDVLTEENKNFEISNNDNIKDNGRNKEDHTSVNDPFSDPPLSLPTKVDQMETSENRSDQINQTIVNGSSLLDSNNFNNLDSSVTGDKVGDIGTLSSDNKSMIPSQYITAGIFGFFISYLMYKFLRKTKPTQYRLWMRYFTNKVHYPKPRLTQQMFDAQQLSIEKDNKILEIKEKLPVIIQNIEILEQFWDNQIFNIQSHIETLKTVDENEKIRFPQQIAMQIKKDWDKQYIDSKANHAQMKDDVTRNSLLTID